MSVRSINGHDNTMANPVDTQLSVNNYKTGEIDSMDPHIEETQSLIKKGQEKAFGKPTITFWGSVILGANNVMGPAMVSLPFVFQQAGWATTTAVLVIMFIFSSFSATMLCEAMQRIPGNRNFAKRYEFATVIKHYYGRYAYYAGQVLINLCLQANNIASIIVAAQVMDDFFIFAFKHSYALQFAPKAGFVASSGSFNNPTPFGSSQYVISLGYVVSMVICIPFGYFNLDENIWFQWFSFVAMLGTLFEFLIQYLLLPWNTTFCPIIGNGFQSQAQVLGTVVFSYAYVITVPSWVNEKKRDVSVNKPTWLSTLIGTVLKFSVGYFGAVAYRNAAGLSSILTVMTQNTTGVMGLITKISVYLFNIGTIVPGIPVFSILIRYNLITGGICGPKVAFFLGVVAPWLVSMWFYQGKGFSLVINWSAILLQGFVNFVIPAMLYYKACTRYPNFRQECAKQDAHNKKNGYVDHEEEEHHTNGTDVSDEEEEDVITPPVNAVPSWLLIPPRVLSVVIIVGNTTLVLATLTLLFYYLIGKGIDLVGG